MLDPPDETNTETSVAGTEAIGEEGSNKTVRTKSQDKLHVDYDQPKSDKVDGVCELSLKLLFASHVGFCYYCNVTGIEVHC